jgi:hypothetical protein
MVIVIVILGEIRNCVLGCRGSLTHTKKMMEGERQRERREERRGKERRGEEEKNSCSGHCNLVINKIESKVSEL